MGYKYSLAGDLGKQKGLAKSCCKLFIDDVITVIIPTNKAHTKFLPVMNSLAQQTLPQNEYEILLILNRPEQKITASLPPNCRHLMAPTPGVNVARNHGISQSQGNILLFLDDDCELPQENYLQKLRDLHEEFPSQMSFGGSYILPSIQHSIWTLRYQKLMQEWLTSHQLSEGWLNQLLGGCSSYKRDVFRRGIKFDENIAYGSSEQSLNLQVYRQYGPHKYAPCMDVIHHSDLSAKQFCRKAFLQGQGYAKSMSPIPGVEYHALLAPQPKAFTHKVYGIFFLCGCINPNAVKIPWTSLAYQAWRTVKESYVGVN